MTYIETDFGIYEVTNAEERMLKTVPKTSHGYDKRYRIVRELISKATETMRELYYQ